MLEAHGVEAASAMRTLIAGFAGWPATLMVLTVVREVSVLGNRNERRG